MIGLIVGVDKQQENTVYRVILKTQKGFSRKIVSEPDLVNVISSGKLQVLNATVYGSRLKGATGDLKRFNNGKNRPLVVVSEIKSNDTVLGYKVADYNGVVKNIKAKEFISYCEKIAKQGGVPVQNCMYIPEKDGQKAHIRTYPGYKMPVEKVEIQKSLNARKPEIVDKTTEHKSKLETLFNRDQIEELRLGKKSNVNIKIYANPKLTADKMGIIRKALSDGLNGEWIADPAYDINVMKYLVADMKYGVDVSYYLNPDYNIEQLRELGSGFIAGVDVSKYADPSIEASKMVQIREQLEQDIWKEDNVNTDSSWK